MIEVKVTQVARFHGQADFFVLLEDPGERRVLPIGIDRGQAEAIKLHLEGVRFPRPLTHDLFKNVLDEVATRMVDLNLEGTKLQGTGRCWTIAHRDPMAYNDPGQAPKVAIEEEAVSDVSDTLTAPGYGVRVYKLRIKD